MSRRGRRWTPQEDGRLIALLEDHADLRRIARVMGRTYYGVYDRIKKIGIQPRQGQSQAEVARLLGVCQQSVLRWRRVGWLRSHKPNFRVVAIEEDDLLEFLEDRRGWAEWRPEGIADAALREWATEMRSGRYVTTADAASRMCVLQQTVGQAIRQGRLPAIRAGTRWLVEASAVERQWPAPRRPRAYRKDPLDAAALERVRAEWGSRPTKDIARDLGVSDGWLGMVGRRRLGLPPLGRGCWRAGSDAQRRGRQAAAAAI